jgi:hypothetical protein
VVFLSLKPGPSPFSATKIMPAALGAGFQVRLGGRAEEAFNVVATRHFTRLGANYRNLKPAGLLVARKPERFHAVVEAGFLYLAIVRGKSWTHRQDL